ncbi:MAG: TOBE domain-containing protein, partial [Alicyclobacillus sp.]|nr:TOBE domain-containing protein [Alicyclobacillus sp.]
RYPALRSAGVIGKKVVLGIRPEDLHDEEVMMSTFPDSVVSTRIEVVEHMGAELYLHANAGGQNFVARVNARFDVRPGSDVKLALDLNKVHIFDAETEQAVMFN